MSVSLMSSILRHSPVTRHSDLLVLLVLADHAHSDGTESYPSAATIARESRLSERRVFDSLARLKAAGLIEATGRSPKRGATKQTSVAYRVMVEERGDATSPLRGDTVSPRGVTFRHKRGDILFRENVREQSIEGDAPNGALFDGAEPDGSDDSGRTGSRARSGRRPTSPGGRARRPRHQIDPERRAAYEALERQA